MGLRKEQLAGLNFVAGSMFYARKEVLFPVLALDLKDSDFEDENKQLDSTLAHTLERIFPAGLILKEMLLADTSSTPEKINCKLTLNHPYTL
jgi:lipopolysaccharide biosynthesis protein